MNRPRVLIVTSAEHGSPDAGDRIVLRRIAAFLEARYDCRTLPLARQEGWRKAARVLRHQAPLELAPYWNMEHRRTFRRALAEEAFDGVYILHEGLFFLVEALDRGGGPSCTLFAHNLLSRFTLDSPVQPLLTALARRYERRFYGSARARLVLISEADKAAAVAHGVVGPDAPVAPPGAPPSAPLRGDAVFSGEAVVTGRYGWWRKARDLKSFAATGSGLHLTGFDPRVGEAIPGARVLASADALDWSGAIRAGVITDTFAGGFKLKTLEYVAKNCVVFSRAPVREEFEGLPFADEFVVDREPEGAWSDRIAALRATDQVALASRFRAFKQACLARYDWASCLEPLAMPPAD